MARQHFHISQKTIRLLIVVISMAIFNLGYSQKNTMPLTAKEQKIFEEAKSLAQVQKTAKSIDVFTKLIKLRPDFTEGYLRLASQYYVVKSYKLAEDAFIKAIDLDPDYDPEMYYSLAQTEVQLHKYIQAAEHLDTYIKTSSNTQKTTKALAQRNNLIFIDNALKHPVPFDPINVGQIVNTSNSEYSPIISVDGQYLIFTRNIKNPGDFIGQEDIFIASHDSLGWFNAIPMKGVNTPQNEGAFAISGDGTYIVFTACDRRESYGSCDLYYSMLLDGKWTRPVNMGKVVNSVTWDSHPTLSVDGRKMIFSSRRKGSIGGSDLWMTEKDDKGSWTTPINLGSVINTVGDDESPFLHPDGQTLYFRSNGRPGMGQFDIYYSRYDIENDIWTEPVNLGYPINTEGNEGNMTVSLDGKTAWFASDWDYKSNTSLHHLDIYSFELYPTARPISTTYVKGTVTDIQTKSGLISNVEIVELKSGKTIFKISTGNDGYFIAALPSGGQYACKVEAKDYIFYSQQFNLSDGKFEYKPYILDIELTPVPIIQNNTKPYTMVLNNIFFDFGSSNLLEKSNYEINNIVQMMTSNPLMKILIVGHTDNIGNEKDNLKLSQNRAKSVYDALISNGIQSERITYEGRGATQPRDDNSTEEGRSKNRRTELVILNN